MKIMINHSLMIPIYEQITDQIKTLIRSGELKENDSLPSVRALSKELKISALTVKKAYDSLVSGTGVQATDAVKAMETSYADGVTDEFVLPTVITDEAGKPVSRRGGDRFCYYQCGDRIPDLQTDHETNRRADRDFRENDSPGF